nr:PREDICTED: uncharacterized protein LOC109461314 isoform X7 [Rhinolophus sinicus]
MSQPRSPKHFVRGGESAQWESRKGRALPVHPIAEAQLLEGIVYWSGVSSKSSCPFLGGTPGDGSHAPDSLAPGPEPWNWP